MGKEPVIFVEGRECFRDVSGPKLATRDFFQQKRPKSHKNNEETTKT